MNKSRLDTKNTGMKGSERWAAFYRTGTGNVYSDENLLRLVRGKYAPVPRSGRVLDVGFGIGGNLIMLAQSGYEAHGLEVSQESIEAARTLASQAGVDLHLGAAHRHWPALPGRALRHPGLLKCRLLLRRPTPGL